MRAAVLSERTDLDEAVTHAERAAGALPTRSVWRMAALIGLNRCLLDSHRRSGAVSALDLAVNASREVVSQSRHHPDLPYRHTALVQQGECLVLRYKATWDRASLDQAVESLRATRDLSLAQRDARSDAYASMLLELHTLGPSRPDLTSALTELHSLLLHDDLDPMFAGPEWASVLLAQAAFVSHVPKQSDASLRRAADKARQVTINRYVPPLQRLRAGLLWGELAIRRNDSEDVVLSYETVTELVPLVLLTSGREDSGHISAWEELSREAAAHAIGVGAPERALEFLEQRSVLLSAWWQDSHAEVDRLREAAPDLVAELRRLWAFLHLAPQPASSRTHRRKGTAPARRLEQLVDAVRALPGFADFLAPVPAERLVAAASEGPVVVLNAAAHRCDALLVTRQGVSVLPLHEVSLTGLADQAQRYRSAVDEGPSPLDVHGLWSVLGWLWDKAVGPVLAVFGMVARIDPGLPDPAYERPTAAPSDVLPRVWWCPTGLFTMLPLHLAGQRQGNAMDYAVHSYTSSLQALTSARHRETYLIRDPGQSMLLVLADDDLPHGQRELEAIHRRVPHAQVLRDAQATDANVAARLSEHTIFHFIGGSHLDGGVTRLRLGAEDGRDRPRPPLPPVGGGALAYLSVRETSGSDLAHYSGGWALATRFQTAGFDHVIALSAWAADAAAADLAREVYERLWTPDGGLRPGRSAHVLHQVVRRAIAESSDRALAIAAVVHLGP
ncbi:hypothetical protein SPURM210S_02028 [Streptomyces purpurascens]